MTGTRADLENFTKAVEEALAGFKDVTFMVEIFGHQRPGCAPKVAARTVLYFLNAFKEATGPWDTPKELALEAREIVDRSLERIKELKSLRDSDKR